MADILTESQIVEIQDNFAIVDSDGDGVIKTSEFGKLLRMLGQNPTDAEIQVSRQTVYWKYFNCVILLGPPQQSVKSNLV